MRNNSLEKLICKVLLPSVILILLFPAYLFSEESYYTTSKSCKKCHLEKYNSWSKTNHSKFMQLPSNKSVLGDFEKNNTLKAGYYTTRMWSKDGKYYVNTVGPERKERDYPVAYVIGTHWKQSYLTETRKGEFYVLPLRWDVQNKKWEDYYGLGTDIPEGKRYWSAFERSWNLKCAGCHVTGLQVNYQPATKFFNSIWVELGVGCEACHGAGSRHVESGDPAKIINPKRFNFRQKSELCGQCHVFGASRHQELAYDFPVGYKPGEPLSDYFSPVEPKGNVNTEHFWGSGQERRFHQQYLGFVASKHYAKRAASCVTCHNPHGSKYLYSLVKDHEDNTLCYTCHEDKWANPTAHTHHHAQSPGSRCSTCHMIYTLKDTSEYYVATHSFWVPHPQDTIKYKMPNACNNCHEDKTPQWALEHVVKWWK